jgi:uncharacterized membrane protein
MIRESLMHRQHEPGFRWRGGEIARIEGLSDAVFAFAVTLLIVSLEVPKTFHELMTIMRGFVAFAICFVLLMQVWQEQYRFFRRYNLQDTMSIMLNCALLFVVLFYVYPLKFLFSHLVNGWMGVRAEHGLQADELPQLMAIFSGGYLAVAGIFVLLFGHALRKREELDLDRTEVFLTKVSIGAAALNAGTAAVSLVIALAGGRGLAGIIYPILLGPGFTIYYSIAGARQKRLSAMVAAATAAPEA